MNLRCLVHPYRGAFTLANGFFLMANQRSHSADARRLGRWRRSRELSVPGIKLIGQRGRNRRLNFPPWKPINFCLRCRPNDQSSICATGQVHRFAHSHQNSQWTNRFFATAYIEKSKRSPGSQFLGSHSFELKQAINPGSAGLPGQVTFKALHPN